MRKRILGDSTGVIIHCVIICESNHKFIKRLFLKLERQSNLFSNHHLVVNSAIGSVGSILQVTEGFVCYSFHVINDHIYFILMH